MPKRVLIVRLSALGDVIFNLPLASILKANGYEVYWITSEKGFDIVNNNPLVDNVILAPIEKWKKQNLFQNFKEYLDIIKKLRTQKFDIAIDTQLLLKSFIWTIFSGARRRIVSKSAREFAILGGNEVIEKLSNDFSTHATEDYLKFARYLGLDTSKFEVELPAPTKEISAKLDNLLNNIDPNKPIITIAPATTWATKHWDKENWKELIKHLENNYNLVFTGTHKDNELIEYISENKHLNLAGKTNILELAELFRRSDLVISLDSGSTHLAWATQKPKIISIFCSTPYTRYAPIGAKDKYIALSGNLSCQPCHKKKCPLKENKNLCTKLPVTKDILEAVKILIK